MGGAPIFIDDGGSIRIKLAMKNAGSAGVMDSLFDVANSQSMHRVDPDNGPYDEVLIFWFDKDGKLELPNPTPIPFSKVTISSDLNLEIEAKIVKVQKNSQKIKTVNLNVSHSNGDPIFESKQHKKKRSYTVVNGGRIKEIVVDTNSPIGIPSSSIYACVVIT